MYGVKISVHATLLQNLFVIFWFYHANGNAQTILEIFMVFTFNYGNSAFGGGGGGGKERKPELSTLRSSVYTSALKVTSSWINFQIIIFP